MSTTIDQKVVSLQFDNKQFESNVSTTMSTLDKLKQKLNLTGAAKGLDDVGASAKKVNLSSISSSAETVGLKFNAMYTMADQALRNITNSAMMYGKRIISALTIDPVKTGFNEYELKLDSIKTIMAGTGESIETVTKHLNELNEYSDQTIYSFADMTQNIGKFTNAGVKLEDAVAAIKGISNEAAVSGANANEASRAMYNFAQALSSGYVKLIDWKSIENANMATMEFKQQLIDTAVSLGQVTKSSDGMYKTLSGKTFNATKSFNDVLQEQWMTSEVLIETLKKYADESTDIGKKAKAAAQDVTKLTQVYDILKETAQSGWAQTWELIFGNIDQAKALFTPLTEFLQGILDKMADARNALLKSALSKNFSKIAKTVREMIQPVSKTIDKVKEATEVVKGITKTLEEHNSVVKSVIRGSWGKTQERWDKLTEAGYDWVYVQNKVNELQGSSVRRTSEYTEYLAGLTKAQEKTTEATKEAVKTTLPLSTAEINRLITLTNMSDEQLKNIGYTKKQIDALRELTSVADKLGIPLGEFIQNMDKIDGRWILINSFKNIGNDIVETFKAISEAWKQIFPPKSETEKANALFDMLTKFHKFTSSVDIYDENAMRFTDTGDKIIRTFKGVFALLDALTTLLAGPIKVAFKILVAILEEFDMDLLDLTAIIGDHLVSFAEWLNGLIDFKAVAKFLIPLFSGMAKGISNFFVGFKDTSKYIFEGLINGLKSGIKKLGSILKEIGNFIIDTINNILEIHSPSLVFMAIGGFIIAGLILGLQNGFPELWATIEGFFGGIIDYVKTVDFGALLAAVVNGGMVIAAIKLADALGRIGAAFEGFGDFMEDFGKGIKRALKGAGNYLNSKAIKNFALAIAILAGAVVVLSFIPAGALWKAVGAIAALMAVLTLMAIFIDKFGGMGTTIDTLKDTGKAVVGIVKIGALLAGIGVALLMAAFSIKILGGMNPDEMDRALDAIITISVIFGAFALLGVVSNTKWFAGSKIRAIGKTIFSLAISIGVMALLTKVLSTMNPTELETGLEYMLVATGLITALTWVVGAAVKGAEAGLTALGKTILKITIAAGLMVLLAKLLSYCEWDELKAGFGYMIVAMGLMVGLIAAVKKISKGAKVVNNIGKTILKIALALGIMGAVVAILGLFSPEQLKTGTIVMGALVVLIIALIAAVWKLTERKSNANVKHIGKTILQIAIAIAAMGLVVALLGLIKDENLEKGFWTVIGFGILIHALIKATKDAKKATGTIVALTVFFAVLAGALAGLSFIEGDKLIAPTIALLLLMGMMALLIKSTKSMGKTKSAVETIVGLAVLITLMAAILWILSKIENPMSLLISLGALIALIGAALGLVLIFKHMKVGKRDLQYATKGALALAAVGAALLPFIGVLYLMQNVKNAEKNIMALIVLAGAMTILLFPLKSIGKQWLGALKGAVALTAMAVPLIAFVGVLAVMSGIQNATSNALVLIALATAMTLLLIPLTLIGLLWIQALSGVLGLLAMAVPLIAFVGVLAVMQHVQDAEKNAMVLIVLAAAMTLLLIPLTLIGALIVPALLGVLGLLAMAVPLIAFVGILALMENLENAQTNTELIIRIMATMTTCLVVVALVGPLALVGIAAIAALTLMIVAIGVLVTAVGALMDKFPQLETFIDKGIPILEKLAHCIGSVLGNLIAGFTDAVASSLPGLGQALGDFMTNAKPFIDGVKQVDDSTVKNVGSLAAAILLLTGADLIDSIVDFITNGSSFADLGSELSKFMTSAKPFIEGAADIDPSMMDGVKAIVDVIGSLTGGSLLDSIVSFVKKVATGKGDSPLVSFGKNLQAFAPYIRSYADTVMGIDSTAVNSSASAAKALSQVVNSVPEDSGRLANFGANIETFGSKLKSYFTNFKDISSSNIVASSNAISSVKSAAVGINPAHYTLAAIGIEAMANAVNKMSKVDSNAAEGFSTAVKKLADVNVSAMTSKFSAATADLNSSGSKLIEAFINGIKSQYENVVSAGRTLIVKLIEGINSQKVNFNTACRSLIASGSAAISSSSGSFASAGNDLGSGLVRGIGAKSTEVYNAAYALGQKAVQGEKDGQRSNSPSKATILAGKWLGEGLVIGIDRMGSQVYKAGSDLGKTATATITSSVSKISDAINSDIDAQPTIRPVLDLSNVRNGANSISSMLNNGTSVGVLANVGAISSMMNSASQNGADSELVSAIDGLRKEMAANPRNVYSINGINVNEGTDAAEAIRALTRAIKIEGRA